MRVTRELVQEDVVAIPVADLAESLQLPMITATATNPQITVDRQHIFRIACIAELRESEGAFFSALWLPEVTTLEPCYHSRLIAQNVGFLLAGLPPYSGLRSHSA